MGTHVRREAEAVVPPLLKTPLSQLPAAAMHGGARAWWHGRIPRHDALTLTQRNVCVLPSRAGLLLAATLVVLLIASINYQLNLGYVLTFLLAGSAAAGLFVGHNTRAACNCGWRPPRPFSPAKPRGCGSP